MLFNVQISQVVFIPRAQPHAHCLLFPTGFGINLIYFFDEKKDGAAGIQSFVLLLRAPVTPIMTVRFLRRMQTLTVSKSATFLTTESVNSAPIESGETKVQIFGKRVGKSTNFRKLGPAIDTILYEKFRNFAQLIRICRVRNF